MTSQFINSARARANPIHDPSARIFADHNQTRRPAPAPERGARLQHPQAQPARRQQETSLALREAKTTSVFPSLRKNLNAALMTMAGFALVTFFLLFRTVIAGAVITSGTLVVESGPKVIQHPTGGVIAQIMVRNGDIVEAGDLLIRMDQKVAGAQLTAAQTALVQQQARNDRLVAERDGLPDVSFGSVDMAIGLPQADYEAIFQSERLQFEARRTQRDSQRRQLRERIAQAQLAITGLETRLSALNMDNSLLQRNLDRLQRLKDQGLVPVSAVSDTERELAQSSATLAAVESEITVKQGVISETELQILQVDQDLRAQLTDQIWQVRNAINQAMQDQAVAQKVYDDSNVIAPHAGTILDLAFNSPGGVIAPGAEIMSIVPDKEQLLGEVRIAPADIDQVYPNQEVTIQFSAFDRGTTPAISGTLIDISAGLLRDAYTGQAYYSGRVKADDSALETLGDLKFVPGMPIEVFIKTGDRSLMTYLTKPILDQVNRAFR